MGESIGKTAFMSGIWLFLNWGVLEKISGLNPFFFVFLELDIPAFVFALQFDSCRPGGEMKAWACDFFLRRN